MTIACPENYPYLMWGGCCANYRKKNDTVADPKCDGSLIRDTDPLICCYADVAVAFPQCAEKTRLCTTVAKAGKEIMAKAERKLR